MTAIRDVIHWTHSDFLSLFQLAFTGLGFWLAVTQLRLTAEASIATKVATQELLRQQNARLLVNDVLLQAPILHQAEDKITSSLFGADPVDLNLLVSLLANYSRIASQLSGLLSVGESTNEKSLISALDTCILAVNRAKAQIMEPATKPIMDIMAPVLKKISGVSSKTSNLIARLPRKVD